jgi:hypothetical protein
MYYYWLDQSVESEAVAILDPSDTQKAEKTTAPEAPLKLADLLHISPNTFSNTSSNSGTKRQRVVTPAASKAIDAEDEPRTSPSFRKTSLANPRQDGDAGDRKVLGIIENFWNGLDCRWLIHLTRTLIYVCCSTSGGFCLGGPGKEGEVTDVSF